MGLLLLAAGLWFLIVRIVGTGLWRSTLRSLTTGDRLPSGLPVGLGRAVGLIAGDLLSPTRRQTTGVWSNPFALLFGTVGPTLFAPVLLTPLAAPVLVVGTGLCRPEGRSRRVWLDPAPPVVLPRVGVSVDLVLLLALVVLVLVVGLRLLGFDAEVTDLLAGWARLDTAARFAATERGALWVVAALLLVAVLAYVITTLVADRGMGGLIAPAQGVVAALFSGAIVCLGLGLDLEPALRICATNRCHGDIWSEAGVVFVVNGIAAAWVGVLVGPWVAGMGVIRRRSVRDRERLPRAGAPSESPAGSPTCY